jgi:hypothetical protein
MNIDQAKTLIESEYVKNFIDICPHCGTKAHLEMIHNDNYIDEDNLIFHVNFKCVPCKKLILETFKFKKNYKGEYEVKGWVDKFPNNKIIYINKFKESVPESILEDFREGIIDLGNKCYKSSVAMFRRSLQSSLVNMGAKETDDLITQIKSMDILTKDIKDWAHNIRILGNWGAHPQDDNLKGVDVDTAEEAKNFMEEFFNYVYVMPNRVKKARPQTEEDSKNIGEKMTE